MNPILANTFVGCSEGKCDQVKKDLPKIADFEKADSSNFVIPTNNLANGGDNPAEYAMPCNP